MSSCCGASSRFTIVNVSSLAAVQAFETWGVYCAGIIIIIVVIVINIIINIIITIIIIIIGKAAREMFHKVMALEQEKNAIKVTLAFLLIINPYHNLPNPYFNPLTLTFL